MNETIGEIGGHNDQKRRIRIKREQRKKLDEYEEEREIKDLEKKVKKQQLLTLIKVLPIAVVGGTIKTIYDTGKKSSGKKSVSSDGVIIEENNDGITQLDRDYDVSDSKEKQFIEEATSKKKIVTTPTGEKVVVDLPKARKEEKKTFFEELFFPTEAEKKPNEISINGEVKKNDEEKLTPFTGISISSDTDYSDTFYDTIEDLDIDSDMLPDYMKEKIEKLKSRKIVEEYEKELKNIRYELRNLVFEYSILEEESDNIIISDEANIILDKLSLIIDKLEELKQKIKIDDISKYDDNYIYTLIEDYLDEFKEYEILDGQQRLTTLCMMMAVLRDLMKKPQYKWTLSQMIYQEENELLKVPSRNRIKYNTRDKVKDFVKNYIIANGSTKKKDLINYHEDTNISVSNMAKAISSMHNIFESKENLEAQMYINDLTELRKELVKEIKK